MLRVLECIIHGYPFAAGRLEAGFHDHAVRDNFEAPALKVADLVLSLTDNDFDDGTLHPLRLSAQGLELIFKALLRVRVRGGLSLLLPDRNDCLDLGQLRLPAWFDPLEHPVARE